MTCEGGLNSPQNRKRYLEERNIPKNLFPYFERLWENSQKIAKRDSQEPQIEKEVPTCANLVCNGSLMKWNDKQRQFICTVCG